MKIAIISPGKLPLPNVMGGAIETLVTHILNQNEYNKKIEIDVFSYYNIKAEVESKKYKKAKFYYIKDSLRGRLYDKIWGAIYKLSKRKILANRWIAHCFLSYARSNKYDAVVVEGNFHQVHQLTPLNVPIILHIHTDILNQAEPCVKQIYKNCSKILVISDFLKQQVNIAVGNSDKVVIYKNAIDTELFRRNDFRSIREEYGIPATDNVALFCGRIVPIKGVFELIKAFHEANIRNLSLLIVGGSNFADSKVSDYEVEIKNYVEDNNLKVFFTGYVPVNQLPIYYKNADFSICPSICNEAAGLVVIEASCAGLPVIASNMGGIPEYANRKSTILVHNDSSFVDNLANAILMMCDANLRTEYAFHSVDEIDKYTVETYYSNFVDIIYNI